MLARLGQFFKDDVGEFSCMRLLVFLTSAVVLGVWVWGNYRAGQYLPLGPYESALLGVSHGSKAAQAHIEYGGARGNY